MKVHPAAWSLALLLATGIVAAGFLAFQPRTDDAPDLTVPTTDGGTFELGRQRGNVVVLDFFQVWCEACAILENQLKDLAPRWNESGVRIVSIGIAPANEIEDLRAYQEAHNLTWTVAQDTDGAVEKFGVVALPTLVVIDPDGRVAFHRVGLPSSQTVDDAVHRALALDSAPVAFAQYSLFGIAVVAAFASFFSPCAIGLLPGYVAHTVRAPGAAAPMRRAFGFGGVAAGGLLLVFLGVGGLAFAFGHAVAPFVTWLAPLAGLLFVGVGILLLVRPFSVHLQRMFAPLTQVAGAAPAAPGGGRGVLGFFLYGVGYGAGAAGCTAPVLLNLVVLGALAGPATGAVLLGVYAGTAALLMAVLTLVVAGGREGMGDFIRRHAAKVETASALLFVCAGVFLLWFATRAGVIALA